MAKARNYREEYKYHGTPEQIENRASRNKARRLMEDKLGKAALANKDVDHKNGVPTDNRPSNLKVTSKKVNRSKK
jgi:DNA replication protein DnaC